MGRHGPEILSFDEMLEDANAQGPPAVILGNGFSRAWSDGCFDYRSLFEDTNLSTRAQAVFQLFQTTDFEAAMRTLVLLRELLGHYDETDGLREELDKDITELREALLQAISEHHPSEAGEVTLKEYRACASFLRRFGKIFTVNYDLLLYWVINHMVKDRAHRCSFDDGFRKPWPQEHLYWNPEKSTLQNVFYLHGGLHIMRQSPYPRKLMWGEDSIMTQLRRILGAGKVPLFVAEGLGSHKMANILTNPYLTRIRRIGSQIRC